MSEINVLPSKSFVAVSTDIAIDGEISPSALQYLSENYKSVLYLCSDGADIAVEGGFATIASKFPSGNAIHVALNPSAPAFQVDCDPIKAVEMYTEFEKALDSLARPTVIICKSARRAGLVYAAYKVNNNSNHTLIYKLLRDHAHLLFICIIV